jgi:transposase
MPLEATVKFCDPIRVPVNDPIFNERDGTARAQLTPVVSFPSQPAGVAPDRLDSCSCSALREARWQAAYYQSMHRRSAAHVQRLQQPLAQAERRCRAKAAARIQELEQQLAAAQARIRQLEQHCFGRKTESTATPDKVPTVSDSPPRPPRRRGQQRHQPGPQRRDHSTLPAVEETVELPEPQRCCCAQGLPFEPFPGTEDSEILAIDVRAHRRVIRRRRYRRACSCGQHPGILTAPPAPRVIPETTLGVSIQVEVLLDK